MNLSLLLDQVLPTGSVLYKDSHIGLTFYPTVRDMEDDRLGIHQMWPEDADAFLERVIKTLIETETANGDPEPTTSIDYAIWKDK